MSSIRVSGNTSGYYDLTVPDIAGNNTLPINQIVAADSSGNVGIGTTGPNYPLEVKGTATTNTDIVGFSNSNGTAKHIFGLENVGAGTYRLLDSGNNNAVFFSGHSADNSYINAGNVGIGTDSPTSPITVTNTVNVLASNAQTAHDNATLRLNTHAHAGSSIGLSAGNISPNIQYIQGGYNEGTTAPITLNPYGGNVMIGTTVEGRAAEGADRFTIADATHSGMTIRSGTGSYGSINFSDSEGGTGEYAGSIFFAHGGLGDKLVLATAGIDRVTISSNSVGIGTQSPASTLDVKGDLRITRNVAAGHASEGNWNFNISMESAAYYGSLYLVPSVSTGELSVMGDKFRVTQSSGVQIISDTGNSTSSDNVTIKYRGTSGGHKSGYLFKDKRDAVNAAVKNNLLNDGVGTAAAELQLYTSTGGTLARGMNISQYGKVEFDKMPNFATRPYYTNVELGSGAVVDFYDAHVNTGNHFNGTTNRFTAPYAGDYYFAFHSNVWKNATGILYFDWYANGSSQVNTYGGRIYGYYAGGWENIMGFVVLPLNANDYVELRAGGGSPKVDGGSYGQFIGYALTTP